MKKRLKALFQIIIVIFSIFSVSLISQPVSAADVCCEKTQDGEFCRYTDSSNCDSSKMTNAATCEQTSYCQLGCCFDPNKNSFSKNVPFATCEENKKHNSDLIFSVGDTDCAQALSTFPRGCCIIADQCSYTTNENCNKISFDYGAEAQFQDIASEFECVNLCRQDDEGCCISPEGCSYTTRNNCVGSEESVADFNYNQYCSSFDQCFCKQKDHKECYDGNIYYFDSCGNREELVKECNYDEGVKCGSVDGKIDCKSLDCTVTPDESNPLEFFPDKIAKNGESWCLYDSKPGPSLDLVGSRHYRVVCIEGEEIVEPCRDFRQEICISADIEAPDVTFREAQCLENRYEECNACNKAEPPATGIKDEDTYKRELDRYKNELKKDKKCCGKGDSGNCFWLGETKQDKDFIDEESIKEEKERFRIAREEGRSIDSDLKLSGKLTSSQEEGEYGVCVPLVPPGNKFWESDSSNECSDADKECTTTWYDPGYFKDPRIVSGEQCETQDFLQASNTYCRSLGDCGAHYNYEGKYSQDGFSFNFAYNKWSEFKKTAYPRELDQPSFSDFSTAKDGLYLGKINAGDLMQGAPLGLSAFFNNFPGGKTGAIAAIGSVLITTMIVGGLTTGVSIFAFKTVLSGLFSQMFTSGAVEVIAATETTSAITLVANPAVAIMTWVAIAVIAYFFITSLGAEKQDLTHTTTCDLWQAPSGGSDCEKCDENPLKPCSEYRCKSLGQLCTFISENEGTNRPTCISSNPNDVNSPIISPWPENLTKPYKLETQANGYEITPAIKPFEEITFGIKTNEPAQCKIDIDMKDYDIMLNFFGNQYYETEHSTTLNLNPGKELTYYIKCKDHGGNKNTVPYMIKLKTQKGPDLTPPIIEGTDLDNQYVAAHLTTKTVSIFINEPVACKYSNINQGYVEMQNTMQCSKSISNQFMSKYKCTADLPVEQGENVFYFTCRDNEGNTNSEPTTLTLIGTESLNITHTEPTGDLPYSDIELKVTTEKGAEQGKAECSYDNIKFLNTDSSQHTQPLKLTKGNYNYEIHCSDIAGNEATTTTSFGILTDETFSEIYYIYKDSSSINLMLDEATICKYSEEEFNFDTEGIDMAGQDQEHSMPLGLDIYYVICEDEFKNKMPTIIIYP